MKLVTAPLSFSPNVCIITGRDDGVLIDFEHDFVGIDPRIYMKREIVEDAARLLGMVPKEELETLADRLVVLDREHGELKARIAELNSKEGALSNGTQHDHS